MKVTVDEKKHLLIVEVPLISPPRPSGSGRTLLVATTAGNKESEVVINNQNVIVGLNAYIYATAKGEKAAKE